MCVIKAKKIYIFLIVTDNIGANSNDERGSIHDENVVRGFRKPYMRMAPKA
jgi:hypothetical protein